MVRAGMTRRGLENPEQITIAIFKGVSLGFDVMQSVDYIAVINGRPCIYGDAAMALIRSKKLLRDYKQDKIGTPGTDDYGYKVSGVRTDGGDFIETTFTVKDAKTAGLWGKSGPWTNHPDRMLLNRARAFFCRDLFPDVLMGLAFREEVEDYEPEARPATLAQIARPERRGSVEEPIITTVNRYADAEEYKPPIVDAVVQKPETAKPKTNKAKPAAAPATESPLRAQVIEKWCEVAVCDPDQAVKGIDQYMIRNRLISSGLAGAKEADLKALLSELENDAVRCDDYFGG